MFRAEQKEKAVAAADMRIGANLVCGHILEKSVDFCSKALKNHKLVKKSVKSDQEMTSKYNSEPLYGFWSFSRHTLW